MVGKVIVALVLAAIVIALIYMLGHAIYVHFISEDYRIAREIEKQADRYESEADRIEFLLMKARNK